ncbi:MAG: hypothetical protein QM756_14250 [Polyangiaceae bacterium]
MRNGHAWSLGFLALACPFFARSAHADENIVRDPDRHPHHAFEAEPHVLLAPLGTGPLPGAGFRGTFTLSESGFIPSINDSVGLGVGIDWTRDNAYVPVVMQWNFWLSHYWSVFAEPGIAAHFTDKFGKTGPDFTLYGGARLRFSNRTTLTLRAGYPALSVGLSFLL